MLVLLNIYSFLTITITPNNEVNRIISSTFRVLKYDITWMYKAYTVCTTIITFTKLLADNFAGALWEILIPNS